MKEMFKKGFGFVMGVYAACICINTIDGYLEILKNNKTNETEQEEV